MGLWTGSCSPSQHASCFVNDNLWASTPNRGQNAPGQGLSFTVIVQDEAQLNQIMLLCNGSVGPFRKTYFPLETAVGADYHNRIAVPEDTWPRVSHILCLR